MNRNFSGKLYKSIGAVSVFIENEVKKLTYEIIEKPATLNI